MAIALRICEVGLPRTTPATQKQAAALRALRIQRGLTQEQVAAGIPMKLETYRGYEKGYTELKLGQFEPFSRALQASMARFVEALGLLEVGADELQVAECVRLVQQLGTEPPEAAETILRWLRESVEVAKLHRQARSN